MFTYTQLFKLTVLCRKANIMVCLMSTKLLPEGDKVEGKALFRKRTRYNKFMDWRDGLVVKRAPALVS